MTAPSFSRASHSSIASVGGGSSMLAGVSPTSSLAAPLADLHPALIAAAASAAAGGGGGGYSKATNEDVAAIRRRTGSSGSPHSTAASPAGIYSKRSAGSGASAAAAVSCPSSITVSAATEPTQAAGLVNFSLSQPGAASFQLIAALTPRSEVDGSSRDASPVCAALRVAAEARRIHLGTSTTATDLAVQPHFSSSVPPRSSFEEPRSHDGTPQQQRLELHMYHVAGLLSELTPGQDGYPTLHVDAASHVTQLAARVIQVRVRFEIRCDVLW